MEATFGVSLISDVSLDEIDVTGQLLKVAFKGDLQGRTIQDADARVAATAFLKDEPLATGDLQFFKRGRDLGLKMEFIGSGTAATRALAYVPTRVIIAKP